MTPFRTVAEVLAAIQTVKSGAGDFCTNFFPAGPKLQDWVDRRELLGDFRHNVVLLFRREREFLRLYFCGASVAALRDVLLEFPGLREERLVTDVVGNEAALAPVLDCLKVAGLLPYRQLQRMVRTDAAGEPSVARVELPVTPAGRADAPTIQSMLERAFDRYAEQLPSLSQIAAAAAGGQIVVVRIENKLAGLLFFETQGATSHLRFWLVDGAFRDRHVGAALMRHYLSAQKSVRRFLLWVIASNENAVQKYRRYGFAPDGLVDHVLVSASIYHETHR